MTLVLSASKIEWLLEMQSVLDDNIKKVKRISNEDWKLKLNSKHYKALKIETAEFVNEMHDVWKYWKDKPIKPERILDEGIDVIHFCCLIINKTGREIDEIHKELLGEITIIQDWFELDNLNEKDKESVIDNLQDDMLSAIVSVYEYFAHVIVLLGLYGFTEEDIIDQYKIKNKENFRRLEQGY